MLDAPMWLADDSSPPSIAIVLEYKESLIKLMVAVGCKILKTTAYIYDIWIRPYMGDIATPENVHAPQSI